MQVKMKLSCETALLYRSKPGMKNRSVSSSIAVLRNTKDDGPKVFIHLIRNPDARLKYVVDNNIQNIHSKFLKEGKCTICFIYPDHDVQIKADPNQLKCLLMTLKSELSGNSADPKILTETQSSVSRAVSTVAKKPNSPATVLADKNLKAKPAQTNLVIKQRGDFPLKGFPRTLKSLSINGIGSCNMHPGVLMLSNLTSLNLSENNIQKLPKGIGNLKLSHIDLTKNDFGLAKNLSDWNWLMGANLKSSLTTLLLTSNKLTFIPIQIMDCENLVKLCLDGNSIRKIPFSIKKLRYLRFLKLNDNQIESWPSSIVSSKFRLDTIDISNNCDKLPVESEFLDKFQRLLQTPTSRQTLSLFELAGRTVTAQEIPYQNHLIPRIIKEVLMTSPTCIECNKFTLDRPIIEKIFFTCSSNLPAQHIISGYRAPIVLDGCFCSEKCLLKLRRKAVGSN